VRAPKLHQPWLLGTAVVWIAAAVFTLALGSGDRWEAVPSLVVGVLWSIGAFLPSWRPSRRGDGPDPLRGTPTGRVRATGWPPSKDPDDYR
jgi:hypothetical protein